MFRRGGTAADAGIYIQDNVFVGFLLGADFCAEHEHGIDPLERSFGIVGEDKGAEQGVHGIERYKSTSYEPECVWYRQKKAGDEAILVYNLNFKYYKDRKNKFPNDIDRFCKEFSVGMYNEEECKNLDREPETLATSWTDSGFAIHVQGKENIAHLKSLKKAIEKNDILLFIGAPALAAFSRGSLTITIASRTPEEGKKRMEEVHKEIAKLKKDAAKTGIESKLAKNDMGFHALAPKRRAKDKTRINPNTQESEPIPDSKYDIIFWLNPHSQSDYNSGWFTVEELEQWIKGKGPVIKEKSKDMIASE